jgi:cytochrome-b5 reductase
MAEQVQQLIQQLQQQPAAIPAIITVLAIVLALAFLQLQKSSKPKAFLQQDAFKPLELTAIHQLTHNTKRFVFSLPDPKMRIGLPTGQHITFLAKDSDGKDVYR